MKDTTDSRADNMKRIILDTQSNRLFRGSEMEQNYDQRGGLCQADKNDAVVTTNPFDPEYIAYWKSLGFTIPRVIVAGPFDPRDTLSELIIRKKAVQEEIKALTDGSKARLEFFCIEKTELELYKTLGIPAYCNFEVSIKLSRKLPFKKLCARLSLPTPPYFFYEDKNRLIDKAKSLLLSKTPILIKANDGIGGIACGGAYRLETTEELETVSSVIISSQEKYFIEKRITDIFVEVVLHWEITEKGKLIVFGFSDLITKNYSYIGGAYPSDIPSASMNLIVSQLKEKLGPHLTRQGAKGHYCCDIIIDKKGTPYWTDFNPRKGATLYIKDMVRRLSEIHFKSADCCFWNESIQLRSDNDSGFSFRGIEKKVSALLCVEEKPFITINNPGVIRFGHVNITGISRRSRQEAQEVFEEAKRRLI